MAYCRLPTKIKPPPYQVHGYFWIPFKNGRSMANHIGTGQNFRTPAAAKKAARHVSSGTVKDGYRPDQIPSHVGVYRQDGRLVAGFAGRASCTIPRRGLGDGSVPSATAPAPTAPVATKTGTGRSRRRRRR